MTSRWKSRAKCFALIGAIGLIQLARAAEPHATRPIALDDLAAIRAVSEPALAPDGGWVVYTVETTDVAADKTTSDIWMSNWAGTVTKQLTFTKASEETPRFSPDGSRISFLSDRYSEDIGQLWFLSTTGGEAEQITHLKGGIEDYAWSPDGTKVALIVDDPDEDSGADGTGVDGTGAKKPVRPIVIDRFYFKEDETGYLTEKRQHLYLLDVATRSTRILTPGNYNEYLPSWSPDSRSIVFVSKRDADPDRNFNFDIFVVNVEAASAAPAGAADSGDTVAAVAASASAGIPTARQLTSYRGADLDPDWTSRPAWSPDGKSIAYLQGGAPELIYYAVHQLAVIPAAGGTPRLLAPALDRNVGWPQWSPDGKTIAFVIEDDGQEILARIPAAGGPIARVTSPELDVVAFDLAPTGRIAVLASGPRIPEEVFALENDRYRPISKQNDALLTRLDLATVETVRFKSKDGTSIGGYIVKPPGFVAGRKYPAILRIHGGPTWLWDREFKFDWQLFAANGYVVLAPNPRGSTGQGEAFEKAIWADWGHRDTEDVLALVDHAVAAGIADPDRLGIGGWSYGGILTDATITQDHRFKAATSGAGAANILAGYGTDMYIREYEAELGPPWKNTEAWLKLSSPFLHADRITTPTLFLCGADDFNVPLLNSEQMYQALRSLGIDTRLVIYPGEYHGLTRPSSLRDRLQRYVDWYGKYLNVRP